MVEEVIEDVVKFQHGGLNNSVDTMSDVMKEYTLGRSDIQGLRKSLNETQSVLTSKKSGQIPLKDLWLKKVELQETLRIVKELESLKVFTVTMQCFSNLLQNVKLSVILSFLREQSAPHRVQRFMQQKKYLTAVGHLNKSIANMFSEVKCGCA